MKKAVSIKPETRRAKKSDFFFGLVSVDAGAADALDAIGSALMDSLISFSGLVGVGANSSPSALELLSAAAAALLVRTMSGDWGCLVVRGKFSEVAAWSCEGGCRGLSYA